MSVLLFYTVRERHPNDPTERALRYIPTFATPNVRVIWVKLDPVRPSVWDERAMARVEEAVAIDAMNIVGSIIPTQYFSPVLSLVWCQAFVGPIDSACVDAVDFKPHFPRGANGALLREIVMTSGEAISHQDLVRSGLAAKAGSRRYIFE